MSTAFYQAHGIPVCPDGDKLRSDEEGVFCIVDGDRVAATLVNGVVHLEPVPEKPASKSKAVKDADG